MFRPYACLMLFSVGVVSSENVVYSPAGELYGYVGIRMPSMVRCQCVLRMYAIVFLLGLLPLHLFYSDYS